MGHVEWRGVECEMYQTIDQVGDKKSTYTYYANAMNKHPVYYEMFGYDTLIGSHFDKYTIDYFRYDEGPIDPEVFHVTDGKKKQVFETLRNLEEVNIPSYAKMIDIPIRKDGMSTSNF